MAVFSYTKIVFILSKLKNFFLSLTAWINKTVKSNAALHQQLPACLAFDTSQTSLSIVPDVC